jgi:hypothetical protein
MNNRLVYIFIVFFLALSCSLFGQFPNSGRPDSLRRDSLPLIDSSDTEALDSIALRRYTPLNDTTRVNYYYWDAPHIVQPIDTNFANFESVKTSWARPNTATNGITNGLNILDNPLDLGVMASAQMGLSYAPAPKVGFGTGLSASTPFRLTLEGLPFYQTQARKPFTDLYYSQISQRNTTLRATFAHEASPKLYYMLHYGLTNAFGFFDRQGVRTQNVVFALRYRAGRSESMLSFFNNDYTAQENGGVIDPASVKNTASTLLSSIAVWRSAAETQELSTRLHFQQYWYNKTVKDSTKDSSGQSSASRFAVGYQLQAGNDGYKYFDTSPLGGDYYGDFLTNNRGVRRYFRQQYIETALVLRYAFGGSLNAKNLAEKPKLLLQARGFYRLNNIIELPLSNLVEQNAGAEGRLWFDIGKKNDAQNSNYVRGDATARFVVTPRALDLYLGGNAQLGLGKWFGLAVSGYLQRAEAGQIQRRLYISQVAAWENPNLRQQQDIFLSARLLVPRVGTSFGVSNQTINNYMYSDTSRILRQSTAQAVNILSAFAAQTLRWRGFGLSVEGRFQAVVLGAELLPLPTWQAAASLYWEGKIFKRMRVRTGANARYWSPFAARGYFPLTQQFYLQTQGNTVIYPILDYFLSAQIYQARIFINAENITQIITGRNYFTAYGYPAANFLVRFGVSWRLFD